MSAELEQKQNKMLTSIRVLIYSHMSYSRVNEAKIIRECFRSCSESIVLVQKSYWIMAIVRPKITCA